MDVCRRGRSYRLVPSLTLLSVFFFGSALQARAYADPGSGALIWQMLVAAFVGVLFYFRRFTSWFKRRKHEPAKDQAPPLEDSQTPLSRSEE
jgi:hypothetical protein